MQHVKLIPSEEGRQAEMALFRRQPDEAERILLQATPPLIYRAIKMNINAFRWHRALDLALKHKTHLETVLAYRQKFTRDFQREETDQKFAQYSSKVRFLFARRCFSALMSVAGAGGLVASGGEGEGGGGRGVAATRRVEGAQKVTINDVQRESLCNYETNEQLQNFTAHFPFNSLSNSATLSRGAVSQRQQRLSQRHGARNPALRSLVSSAASPWAPPH